jgi:death-associated protein kinase
MSPGLAVDKYVLSASDLRLHRDEVHAYSPGDVLRAMIGQGGRAFHAVLKNTKSKKKETLLDLLCFGSAEISTLLKPGSVLHISEISTLTRQILSHLLDPEDKMGKDWCLLAVRMGLTDKVPKLEGGKATAQRGLSQTAKLLDEWERGKSSSIGDLLSRLEDIGREDAVSALIAGCPMYRISAGDELLTHSKETSAAAAETDSGSAR